MNISKAALNFIELNREVGFHSCHRTYRLEGSPGLNMPVMKLGLVSACLNFLKYIHTWIYIWIYYFSIVICSSIADHPASYHQHHRFTCITELWSVVRLMVGGHSSAGTVPRQSIMGVYIFIWPRYSRLKIVQRYALFVNWLIDDQTEHHTVGCKLYVTDVLYIEHLHRHVSRLASHVRVTRSSAFYDFHRFRGKLSVSWPENLSGIRVNSASDKPFSSARVILGEQTALGDVRCRPTVVRTR